MSSSKSIGSGIKERFRKFLVTIKRRPQIIPMIFLIITFLIFSLNLSQFSNTTAQIQGKNMGLYSFIIFLLSILSFVCLLNAFPHRSKVKVPMLVLAFAMLILVAVIDILYYRCIISALTRAESPIEITEDKLFVLKAKSIILVHFGFLVFSIIMLALIPVYGKLLKKINTSIEVVGNDDMGAIDIEND